MVKCKCYKCYVFTHNFILIRDKDGKFQSICYECDEKKGLWYLAPLFFLKNLCCCGKKTTETLSQSRQDIQNSISNI
jgi:hypothetical protein